MAEKKMTRAQAIEFAIDNITANCMGDMEKTGANEAIEILEKMRASITKPRAKSEGPSKARKDNERLARELAAAIPEGAEVTAKWVTEHVRGVLTTQKAAAVARVGVEMGIISKVVDGRKVTYTRA